MIDTLCAIAREAGKKIMSIYESGDFESEIKPDSSPLTKADKAAHEIICSRLQENFPIIPIISEEDDIHPDRNHLKSFFLVDPLDGTKEFLQKNDEFTVNIGLIKNNQPWLGVVYLPVNEVLYFATKDYGAFKADQNGKTRIGRDKVENAALLSRSHGNREEKQIIKKMGIKKIIYVGSSIKFCRLAEGKAKIYLRKTPICLWDIAAAAAVAAETGAVITDYNGSPIDFSGPMIVDGIKAIRESHNIRNENTDL